MLLKREIWGYIAIVLILLGGILFCVAMGSLGWDFGALSTVKYETNTYDFSEEIQDIKITTATADVKVLPWEEGFVRVVCFEESKVKHQASYKDGQLTVEKDDQRKWYDYIGLQFKTPSVTVYLPNEEYGLLSIKSSTGDITLDKEFTFATIDMVLSTGDVICYADADSDIRIKVSTGDVLLEGVVANSISIETSTGDVLGNEIVVEKDFTVQLTTGDSRLTAVSCGSFTSQADTGDLTLSSFAARETISILRTTGDVIFEGCDGAEITVETSTGDVRGSLLSGKNFSVSRSTGKVEIPENTEGGSCTVKTSTGDIILNLVE